MALTTEQLEEIGKVADTLDNLIAAAKIPLSPEKKLQYTIDSLREQSAKLKSVFVAVSGDNPWSDE